MSRFLKALTRFTKPNTQTFEGSAAWKLSPELELYSIVATSLMDEKFYQSSEKELQRLRQLVQRLDGEYIAQLAVYARRELNMRTIPLILVTLLAYEKRGTISRSAVRNVIRRADEIRELLGCAFSMNPHAETVDGKNKEAKALPHSIVRGIRDVFESGRFDEYQFSKYNRSGTPSFVDALRLTHPRPKDSNQSDLFKKILDDQLETALTWESELSAAGSNPGDKARVWTKMIRSKKLGYMALLRNLRNLLQVDLGKKTMHQALKMLVDDAHKGKQLPFRYWAAYREIGQVESKYREDVEQALEAAVLQSIRQLPDFKDGVLVGCDVSGSMMTPVSQNSSIQNFDLGLVFGGVLRATQANTRVCIFGDSAKEIRLSGKVLADTAQMVEREGEVGYSTNGHKVLELANSQNWKARDVFLFTDCQLWPCGTETKSSTYYGGADGSLPAAWATYRQRVPHARLWVVDLAGYGKVPININRRWGTILVSGWSDKVFETVDSLDRSSEIIALIKRTPLD